jgi:E1-E2 ATPase
MCVYLNHSVSSFPPRFLVAEGPLPCDALLTNGRAVVDESMLTGEAVPIGKSPFEGSEEIDPLRHSGHLLLSGTKVKSVKPHSIAVVYRTGFRSSKGQLIASLLDSKEGSLGFFSDAMYVILFMFVLASFVYLGAAHALKKLGAPDSLIVLKYLDAITIAVPPALTTCLIVATSIAIKRLNAQSIFVSDNSRINWAGTVRIACFDKTGRLFFAIVRRLVPSELTDCGQSGTLTTDQLNFEQLVEPKVHGVDFPKDAYLLSHEVMSACHGLCLVDGQVTNLAQLHPELSQLNPKLYP